MRHRSQALVIEGLDKVADELPHPMLGVDSGYESAFLTRDQEPTYPICSSNGEGAATPTMRNAC